MEKSVSKSVIGQWRKCLSSRFCFEFRRGKTHYSLYAESLMRAYARLSYALKKGEVKLINSGRSRLLELYACGITPLDLPDETFMEEHKKSFAEFFYMYHNERGIKDIFKLELFQFRLSDDEEEEIIKFGLRHYGDFYTALETYGIKRVNDFLKDLKYEE